MKKPPFDRSLEALFDILDDAARGMSETETKNRVLAFRRLRGEEAFERGLLPEPALLPGAARDLCAIAPQAYGDFLSAWMSELPVEAEMIRFGVRAIESGEVPPDRGDSGVSAVLEASYKAAREIDRLMGLLRFSPVSLCQEGGGSSGRDTVYAARCAPDHHVLPGLAGHFGLRFGGENWAVIDEKRRAVLLCKDGEPCFVTAGEWACRGGGPDPYAGLWRLYHRSINNDGRNNAELQRQFLPVRYRKYLTEFDAPENGEAEKGAVQGTLDFQ
ncbi:MAG: TIGR03915 family putative DNA repair protein [Treponema sp.]|jgi:probable DNA metabolism protein|nr:TIGR03915 family putative DNA repair protein [Treponema sp.]